MILRTNLRFRGYYLGLAAWCWLALWSPFLSASDHTSTWQSWCGVGVVISVVISEVTGEASHEPKFAEPCVCAGLLLNRSEIYRAHQSTTHSSRPNSGQSIQDFAQTRWPPPRSPPFIS